MSEFPALGIGFKSLNYLMILTAGRVSTFNNNSKIRTEKRTSANRSIKNKNGSLFVSNCRKSSSMKKYFVIFIRYKRFEKLN